MNITESTNNPMKEKIKVVVVGGGFGGAYTAKNLAALVDPNKVEITLVSKNNHFLFTPLLHEVASGGLTPTSVVEPLREILRGSNVHFLQAEVKAISEEKKFITISGEEIPYDYLVLSSGAETNYYGVPGAEKHTHTLKDLSDAITIRNRIIEACEKAALTTDENERRHLLSCIIVGGGATGVELAAEIVEYLEETICAYGKTQGLSQKDINVSLIAASAELIPQFPQALRRAAHEELTKKDVNVFTNAQAVSVSTHGVILADGTVHSAHTVIWVAGVKPLRIEIPGATNDKGGRVITNQFLQVQGNNHIWCLGDVANFTPTGTATTPLPMLAQVAVQQAKTVAKNIHAVIVGKPQSPFVYKSKGLLISLGQWYAAGTIFNFNFRGPVMWWVWRTVYLFNFHSWRKRLKIAVEWTINLFYPRDITYLR